MRKPGKWDNKVKIFVLNNFSPPERRVELVDGSLRYETGNFTLKNLSFAKVLGRGSSLTMSPIF
jgi:hypothetical protein